MLASVVAHESLLGQVTTALQRSIEYCQANDWAGYDPYDALNSRILEKLSFLDSRILRIALTQLLKRSPVNLRPALAVPKTQNPKALGLFLSAFTKLAAAGIADYGHHCTYLTERLEALRSCDQRYWCLGIQLSLADQNHSCAFRSSEPGMHSLRGRRPA